MTARKTTLSCEKEGKTKGDQINSSSSSRRTRSNNTSQPSKTSSSLCHCYCYLLAEVEVVEEVVARSPFAVVGNRSLRRRHLAVEVGILLWERMLCQQRYGKSCHIWETYCGGGYCGCPYGSDMVVPLRGVGNLLRFSRRG